MNFELWSNPLFKLGDKKILLTILIFLFAVSGVWAIDYTWTGVVDSDWTDPDNWTPLVTGPPSGVGDTATIPDLANDPVLSGNVTVGRLTLATSATITGAGNLTVNGTGTTTIAGDISLPGNTVTISSDDVVINGSVNVTTGTIDITTTGDLTGTGSPALTADTIDLSGVTGTIGTSGAVPLETASGSAAASNIFLPGNSLSVYVNHTGDLDVDFDGNRDTPGNDLSIVATGALDFITTDHIYADGSTLTLQGDTVTILGRLYIGTATAATVNIIATGLPPTIDVNTRIELHNSSNLNVTGDFDLDGSAFILADGSDATFSGSVDINTSGVTTLSDTSTITMTGTGNLASNNSFDPGDLVIDGDVTMTSNITVDVLTINNSATLDTNGYTITRGSTSGSGSLVKSWDNFGNNSLWSQDNNWNPFGVPGAAEKATIPVVVANAGDVNINSVAAVGGLSVKAHTVNVNAGFTINGDILNESTVNVNAALGVTGSLTNTGTLDGTGNTITVSGGWANSGTFTAGGGTVILDGLGDLACGGVGSAFNDLTISGTTTLTEDLFVTGNLTINGTLNANDFNITVGGNLTNSGTLTNGSTASTLSGGVTNSGTINAGGGGLTIGSITANSGIINGDAGGVAITTNVTSNNGGTINAGTTALTIGGTLNNASGTINGDAGGMTITGNVTSNNSGDININGTGTVQALSNFTNTSGTITFGSTGNLNVDGTFSNGTIAGVGVSTATFGGTTTFVNYTATNNTIIFDGVATFTSAGQSLNGVNVNAGGTVTLSGSMDVNRNLAIAGGGSLTASGTSPITCAGNWSNGGTFTHGSDTVTFDGAGTSVIAGATTFNNFTAVTPGQTIDFGLTTTTVSGNFTVDGAAAGTRINLTGGGWTLNNSAGTVDFAIITNSTVSPAGRAVTNSLGVGVNVGWIFPGTYTWSGLSGVDTTDWTDNANWVGGTTPGAGGAGIDVVIPATGFTINTNLPATLTLDNLTVGATSSLDITATNGLTVTGTFTNSGTVLADEGLTFTGTLTSAGATSLITYSGAGTTGLPFGDSYQNLTFNGGTWTPGADVTIGGDLTVSAGTLATVTGVLSVGTTSVISGTLTNGTAGSTLTGGVTNSGTINAGAGGITIGSITLNSGTINGDAGGVVITGAVTSNNGGTINVGTTTLSIGTTLNNASGTINGDGGGVTITGAVTSNNAGNINLNGAGPVSVGGTLNNGSGFITFTSTGNLDVTGDSTWGGTITGVAGTSTTFGGSVTLGTYTAAGNTLIFNGGPGGTFTSNGQALNDVTVNSAGTVTISGSMDVNGTLALAGGILTTDGTAITCAGDWNNTGGTFTQNGETVTFDGTGTITSDSDNFYSVTLSGGGTIDTADPLNATRDFTITGGTIFNTGDTVTITRDFIITNGIVATGAGETIRVDRNLTLTTGSLTLGDTLDVNNRITLDGAGGTLNASGNNITVAENWLNTGGTFNSGAAGSVTFDTLSDHTITANGNAFYDVVVNSNGRAISTVGALSAHDFTLTAGTVTMGGILTLSNDLNIAGGQIFNTANYNFTVTGSLLSTGTLRVAGTQLIQSIGTMGAGSGLVEYTGTGNVLLNNFEDLEIAGTGTLDLDAAKIINGDFTLSAGTLTTSDLDINVGGDWNNTGGTFTSGTGTATVTFDGTGPQSLTTGSQSFHNLIVDNGGNLVTVSNPLTVAYDLTLTDGSMTTTGSALSVTNDLVLTTGTLTLGNTLNVDHDVSIAATAVLATGDNNITVAEDWTNNSGTPAIGGGTVTFDTTNPSIIAGTTTFNDFTCNTPGKVISFTTGTTQTIDGIMTIGGTGTIPVSYVTLKGTGAASWNLNLSAGLHSIEGVDLQWCNIDDAGDSHMNLSLSQNSGNNDEGPGVRYCIFGARNFVWDGGAGTTNWSDANNWNYNRVPNATDNIEIVNTAPASQPATVDNTFITTRGAVNDLRIISGTMLLSGGDLDVNGDFDNAAVLQRSNDCRLDLSDSTQMALGNLGGTGTVEYVDSAATIQDYSVGGNDYYNLVINATGFSVSTGTDELQTANDLTVTAGTLTTANNNITVTNDLNLDDTLTITGAGYLSVTGTTDIAGTGTFTNGTALTTLGGAVDNDGTINVGGSIPANGVIFSNGIDNDGTVNINGAGTVTSAAASNWDNDSGVINFTSTGNLDVNGNFIRGGNIVGNGLGAPDPVAYFAGDVTLGSYTANGDSIVFDGGAATGTFNTGGATLGDFTVNRPGGRVTLASNDLAQTAGRTGILTAGELNLGGRQWTLQNNLIIPNGASVVTAGGTLTDLANNYNITMTGNGSFNASGGGSLAVNDVTVSNDAVFNAGGTPTISINDLILNDNANVDFGTGELTVNDLTVNNGALIFTGNNVGAGNAHTVNGNFQQTGGTVSLDISTLTINGNYTQTLGTPDTNSGTIVMGGASVNTIESANGVYNLTINDETNITNQALVVNNNLTLAVNFGTGGENMTVGGNWNQTGGSFTHGGATVTFTNTAERTIDWLAGNFNNVTVSDNSRVRLNTGSLNVNGILTIGTTSGTFNTDPRATTNTFPTYLDMVGNNFIINDIINRGAFRLHGDQAIQSITTHNFNLDGWIDFYGASTTLSNPVFSNIYNMKITSGTYTMGQAITILGNSGDRDFNGSDWDDEGLFIVGGTLFAGTPTAYTITVNEVFYLNDPVATFNHDSGEVILGGSGDWMIDGNITFYDLTCNKASDVTTDKDIYFVLGDTIVIAPFGTFLAHGNLMTQPVGGVLDDDPDTPDMQATTFLKLRPVHSGVYPPPGPNTHWWLHIQTNGNIDMDNVGVWYSDASLNNFIIPPGDVRLNHCLGWYLVIDVGTTETVDIDGNGKIDHLRVTTDAVTLRQGAAAFDDFTVTVSGYTVLGYKHTLTGDVIPVPAERVMYVELEEKNYLDTGAKPVMVIVINNSLSDSATQSKLLQIPAPYTAGDAIDDAPPVIGYTLAIAGTGKREIFIHFSEPISNGGGPFAFTDFTTAAGGGVNNLDPVTGTPSALQEALLTLTGDIAEADVTSGVTITVGGTPEDLEGNALLGTRNPHRITDLGLGIVSAGIFEPVVGQDQTLTYETSGVGICNAFDGSDWLKPEDMTLQIFSSVVVSDSYSLIYETSGYLNGYKVRDVWVPDAGIPNLETFYSGLFAYPYSSGSNGVVVSGAGANLTDFSIAGSDSHIKNGVDFEFYLENGDLNGYPLYYGRVEDDGASDWYRHVGPWKFKLRDIIQQKGGISILHNIFDPTRGEKVSVHMNLDSSTMILIQVFDLAGGLVRVIQRGTLPAGENIITWDGRNNAGNVCARGVYFIRVNGSDIDEMRKVLIKK